jgi:hypothetical protein
VIVSSASPPSISSVSLTITVCAMSTPYRRMSRPAWNLGDISLCKDCRVKYQRTEPDSGVTSVATRLPPEEDRWHCSARRSRPAAGQLLTSHRSQEVELGRRRSDRKPACRSRREPAKARSVTRLGRSQLQLSSGLKPEADQGRLSYSSYNPVPTKSLALRQGGWRSANTVMSSQESPHWFPQWPRMKLNSRVTDIGRASLKTPRLEQVRSTVSMPIAVRNCNL